MVKRRWLSEFLHRSEVIDDGALIFLTIIDIVLSVVFFIACSIDELTTIGMVMLGMLIPIIKVRSWIKRNFIPGLIWSIVTAFAGLSFMLTTIQTQDAISTPGYVLEAKTTLEKLQTQQSDFRNAGRRTDANAMQDSIDTAQGVLNAANEKANMEVSHVKALSVFGRIPLVFENPSAALLIATVFYLLIFGGFEWTIYTIATEMGKDVPEAGKCQAKAVNFSHEERFDDVSDREYRKAAEYGDGSIKLPEIVAEILGITEDEANRKHSEIYPGYVFKDNRFVKIKG